MLVPFEIDTNIPKHAFEEKRRKSDGVQSETLKMLASIAVHYPDESDKLWMLGLFVIFTNMLASKTRVQIQNDRSFWSHCSVDLNLSE